MNPREEDEEDDEDDEEDEPERPKKREDDVDRRVDGASAAAADPEAARRLREAVVDKDVEEHDEEEHDLVEDPVQQTERM